MFGSCSKPPSSSTASSALPVSVLFDSPERRASMDAFARDYVDFLSTAKTDRLAVRRIASLASARANASVLTHRGKALALAIAGSSGFEHGVDLFVASLSAPALRVKQNPLQAKHEFTLLGTSFSGFVAGHRWLSAPLALYGYVARDPEGATGLDLKVGDGEDDPVFVVPDLLPHLSYKAQATWIIKPENVAALADLAPIDDVRRALSEKYGLSAGELEHAELAFVPAGAAEFVGVDRAYIAGYGHSGRAAAYAFARALIDAKPKRSTMVILVSGGLESSTNLAFVRHALGKWIGASDEPDARRVIAKSRAYAADPAGGSVGKGPVLNQVQDDAFPRALRATLRAFERGRVPYQLAEKFVQWPVVARELSRMNLDSVGLSIAVSDVGAPVEVVSTVDLFALYRAARALVEEGE